jgi:hypothetical protein
MGDVASRKASAIIAIQKAFAERPLPGSAEIVPSKDANDDAREVYWKYRERRWNDIPRELLGHTADDLSFMTPLAFVYFLPRYLVEALEHYDEPGSSIPEDVVFQLTARAGRHSLESRMQLLSDPEKEAIGQFRPKPGPREVGRHEE